MVTTYGLIGRGISHSASPELYNGWFKKSGIQAEYKLFDMEDVGHLRDFLKEHEEIAGLNVTSPFKRDVVKHLDAMTRDAESIGSVNVILVKREPRLQLIGFNTDYPAFHSYVMDLPPRHRRNVLIFGNGGVADSIRFAFKGYCDSLHVVTRHPGEGDYTYESLTPQIISVHKVLINATPVGMSPNADDVLDIPYDGVSAGHVCIDLIYNPAATKFLQKCMIRGAAVKNGMAMLYKQAAMSAAIWNLKI